MKKIIKTYLQMPHLLKDVFTTAPKSITALLEEVYNRENKLSFVQIGANDGIVNDNMHDFLSISSHDNEAISGACLEPQKAIFEDLRQTYTNYPHVTCYNVALSDENETRKLYNIAPQYQQNNSTGHNFGSRVASFDRQHIIKHWQQKSYGANQNLSPEDYICEEDVTCQTFDTFTSANNIQNFDVLMIDTEGFDAKILEMVNLEKYRVKAVVLEHLHLNAQEKKACYNKLKQHNFAVSGSKKDLWGIRA